MKKKNGNRKQKFNPLADSQDCTNTTKSAISDFYHTTNPSSIIYKVAICYCCFIFFFKAKGSCCTHIAQFNHFQINSSRFIIGIYAPFL